MIGGFKIICGTWATNVVVNHYYPCTRKCLESFSNTDYVDEVIMANGCSTDDTVEKHQDIAKINILETTPWDTNELSQKQVVIQINDLIKEISSRDEKIIFVLTCADVIFSDEFRKDLKKAIEKMVSVDRNFMNLPFAKVVTKDVCEKMRPLYKTFYTYSMIKFTPKIKWKKIGDEETSISGNVKPNRMKFKWKHPMLSYETWFFEKEDMRRKQKDHFAWNKDWSFKYIIDRIYKSKLKRFGQIDMGYEDHPKEGQDLIDMLEEKHAGYSLFSWGEKKILREEEIGKPKASGDFVALKRLRHHIVCIQDVDGKIIIERIAVRSKIRNKVDSYELITNGNVEIKKLDLETANYIVDSIVYRNKQWSDAFVVSKEEFEVKEFDWVKSEEEHKFTSTGIKFWRHKGAMEEYRAVDNIVSPNNPKNTVISTHISPEGACNLKCPYCSVTYRDTHSRIALPRIKDYVEQLVKRGLKAVILTGGGEPTLYKRFNELVQWLKLEKGLSVGLITNGTQTHRIHDDTMKCFSWVRVSVNVFDEWETKIKLDKSKLDKECVVGCSMVYTVEHQSAKDAPDTRKELFEKVSKIADNCGAEYIRLLPNCLLEQKHLLLEHAALQKTLEEIDDPRFFQQYKVHGAPKSSVCHQAYFRPYLSEEPWEDGEPGTVYPCDSVVLNDSVAHFNQVYGVAKLEDVGKFLDGDIKMKFDPREKCHGCVFTDNVNMLDDWKNDGKNRFEEFGDPLKHEEFV